MKFYFLPAALLIFGAHLNAQLNYPQSFVPHGPGGGGMLHVETRENQTHWLGLRDVSGKLIKTADLHTPGLFSLEGIAPGAYWLEDTSNSGRQGMLRLVVVERRLSGV